MWKAIFWFFEPMICFALLIGGFLIGPILGVSLPSPWCYIAFGIWFVLIGSAAAHSPGSTGWD